MFTDGKIGKYEIHRLLGRGSMGTVHEAWDPIIARRVAIKTITLPDVSDPETEEALVRFRREAQAAGRMHHPNIVSVFDYIETNDMACIVMEFIDGPTLKSLLDTQQRFPISEIVCIMSDVLAGLSFSHSRGVVHRDLKPGNIILTTDGKAKIADFGIARIEDSTMTYAGSVLGTPAYMSPEQILGQMADARSDIYSAGVIIYQLLTGKRPFEGTMSSIVHNVLNSEPVSPSTIVASLPNLFDSVVSRAMAKAPEERFSNAAELANALREAGRRHLASSAPALSSDGASEETLVIHQRPLSTSSTAAGNAVRLGRTSKKPRLLKFSIISALALFLGAIGIFAFRYSTGDEDIINSTDSVFLKLPRENTPLFIERALPTLSTPAVRSISQSAPSLRLGVASLSEQIIGLITAQPCLVVQRKFIDDSQDNFTVTATAPALEVLRRTVDSQNTGGVSNWQWNTVGSNFCVALDLLKPIVPLSGESKRELTVTLVDGRPEFLSGIKILPRIVMADFRGALRVDYITNFGTVRHMYPLSSDPVQSLRPDPVARIFSPHDIVDLRNAGTVRPTVEVNESHGSDMIIAIQSSEPLFEKPRPSNTESIIDYFRDLRAALDIARGRGVRVIGSLAVIDPK